MKIIINQPSEDVIQMFITHCCDGLRVAIENKYMGFGDFDIPTEQNTKFTVNIYKYNEAEDRHDSYPIRFCPFCGKVIKVEVERRSDYKH